MTNQSASAVLMVRPHGFGYDEETAKTNSFQRKLKLSKTAVKKKVNQEFEAMVDALRAKDINVVVGEYAPQDALKPNAIFVNNWLSTWPNGDIFMYPMAHEHRRLERDLNIIKELDDQFAINRLYDLSEAEVTGNYLEGTGVMIFDHLHKTVYACVSSRCNPELFKAHANDLGYKPILFHAFDGQAKPIYHTNVMLALQTETAVICDSSIPQGRERDIVMKHLLQSGREVVQISHNQLTHFCANVLEVRNNANQKFLVMSRSAYDAFTDGQKATLTKDKQIITCTVPTIEALGGGSVRCMLAEVFLPKR